MRRYLDNAVYWDFWLVLIFGGILLLSKPILNDYFMLPKIGNVNIFIVSLIAVSATLIGFLLTIITVIVTFKRGFEKKNSINNTEIVKPTDFPKQTIFDEKISKEVKFYETPIYKQVVDIFVNATFEIGLILGALLFIQINIFRLTTLYITVISICAFLLLIFSIIRCLYIFKLFLKVHLQ